MKKAKKVFFFVLISIILIVAGFAYFLFSKEAPITQGEVTHQVEYKAGKALDVYAPTRDIYEKKPVLVYFHGGAWVSGIKEAINNNRYHGAINKLRENGYVVISPEYTLAAQNQSPFPACVEDALDVMKWIEAHAEELQFDLKNVGIMGESAGAHIAMMAAYANTGKFSSPYTYDLQYVVDVYGPSDLSGLYESSPIRKTVQSRIENLPASVQENLDIARYLFGFNPEEDTLRAQEFAATHSPVSYLEKNATPILMIHGEADRVVPIEQSLDLKVICDSLGIGNELHVLENMDHGFIGATAGQRDSVQVWVYDFVKRHYVGKE